MLEQAMESVTELISFIGALLHGEFDSELICGREPFLALAWAAEWLHRTVMAGGAILPIQCSIEVVLVGLPVTFAASQNPIKSDSFPSKDVRFQTGCRSIPPCDPSTRKNL